MMNIPDYWKTKKKWSQVVDRERAVSWFVSVRPSYYFQKQIVADLRADFGENFQFDYDAMEPWFFVVFVKAENVEKAIDVAMDALKNYWGFPYTKINQYEIFARRAETVAELKDEDVHILSHSSKQYRDYLYRSF